MALNTGCACRYVEIADEALTDLLSPGTVLQLLPPGSSDGLCIKNVTTAQVDSEADFTSKFRIGLRQRTTSMCEFGPLKDRSSAVLCVCLTQDINDPTDPDNASSLIVSRIYFVDTPGAERLALDPTSLRIKEGPTLNKSLLGLASLVKSLANPNDSPFAEYGHCVLTTLLQVCRVFLIRVKYRC